MALDYRKKPATSAALGAATALAVVLITEAIPRSVLPNPGVFHLLAIAFCGFLWGFPAAISATPVIILATLWRTPEVRFEFEHEVVIRICVFSGGAIATAIMVGLLKSRADRSLEAVEGRYHALLQVTPNAVFVQRDGRFVYMNEEAVRLFGGSAAHEFLGRSMWDFVHPDSRDLIQRRTRELFEGAGRTDPIEQHLRRLDGSSFHAEVAGRRVIVDGHPAALVVVHDLTRRRAMEERIHRQLRDLSLLHEVSRALLFGLAPREIPEYLCALAIDRLSVSAVSVGLVGEAVELTDPDDAVCMARAHSPGWSATPPLDESLERLARRAVRAAKPVVIADVSRDEGFEGSGAPPDGCRSAAAFPLMSGDQVVAVMTVCFDGPEPPSDELVSMLQSLANLGAIALSEALAHEQIRGRAAALEVAVASRTQEMRELVEELESFTYSVSHDLRAPLRAISGFAEIVIRRFGAEMPDGARPYLDNVVQAAAHMGKLIDDLLNYARLGRRGVDSEPVRLTEVLATVLRDLGGRIAQSGAVVETVGQPVTLQTDPTLLRQVLTNLIDNALTYHRPGEPPRVTISWQPDPDGLRIAVADRGIGIPPEHRQSIFKMFQRLHSNDEYPGTGIGLAIVKKSAQLMGGEVQLESEEGKGSTFTLRMRSKLERV